MAILNENEAVPNLWLAPRQIANLIVARQIPIDSDNPEVVVRKFLNRARKQGKVVDRQLDGRTKGYRISDHAAKTPGDAVDATPPGSIAATRSGGDEVETAPSHASTVPQGHDPASSERDDRDHHRLADDRVAVEF